MIITKELLKSEFDKIPEIHFDVYIELFKH